MKRTIGYYFLSLSLTLLVIVPIFALVGVYRYSDIVPTDNDVTGVPISVADIDDAKNILLVIDDINSFVLLRFDALQREIVTLCISPDIMLADRTAVQTLEYAGAGLVTTQLEEVLGVEIHYFYQLDKEQLLSLSADFASAVAGEEVSGRFEQLSDTEISPVIAAQLIAQQQPEDTLLMRSVCYSLLLQENLDRIHETTPDRIRALSGEVVTNIPAQDIYHLEEIFGLLRYSNVNYYAATLVGEQSDDGFVPTEDDLDKVTQLLS